MEYNKSNNIAGSKIRNSNIELLRIFAMFAIVISHNAMVCGIDSTKMPLCFNRVFLESMRLGKLGVAIFVMITGYYMCKTKFKLSRIVSIVLQTLFYSITFFIVFCIVDRNNFDLKNLTYSFFPIITSKYWFVTAFIILSLIIPFLNPVINSISKQKMRVLIIILAFFTHLHRHFLILMHFHMAVIFLILFCFI